MTGSEFDAGLVQAGTGEPEETVLDALDDALRAVMDQIAAEIEEASTKV